MFWFTEAPGHVVSFLYLGVFLFLSLSLFGLIDQSSKCVLPAATTAQVGMIVHNSNSRPSGLRFLENRNYIFKVSKNSE